MKKKAFLQNLSQLAKFEADEVEDLVEILKQEYGIAPAQPKQPDVLNEKQTLVCEGEERCLMQVLKKKHSRNYFVPKKIGKESSKPKRKFIRF